MVSRSLPARAAAALTLLAPLVLADGTEQSQASIHGTDAECAAYGYQPVTDAISSGAFPAIVPGVPLPGLLASDTEGHSKFNSFSANIPKLALKGANGTFDQSIVSGYNAGQDPDCWWTTSQCVLPKAPGLEPDIATVPEPRTVGYGFDDGPACDHNEFYDFLLSQKQQATFFYIGINVMNNPLQAQRAVTDGHEICVHTWSHQPMTTLTDEQAFAELWYTIKAIKLVAGYTPTCWRPPQGDVDDRIRFIAQQLGLQNVLWKFDSFDWENGENGVTPATVQSNYDTFINAAKTGQFDSEGAIILAHELQNFTMGMAVTNYPKIAAAFDHIVPVGTAFNKTQPYVETDFKLPSFSEYVNARGGNLASSPTTGGTGGSSSSSAAGSKSTTSSGSSSTSNSNNKANSTTSSTSDKGSGALAVQVPRGAAAFLAVLAAAAMLL